MIISASRRTDIPAFYSEWLVNRLRQGFVLVRNPMNFRHVSRINLSPESVESLVFWSKNPRPMMARLAEIADLGYHFYFLFTLTGYDSSIEKNIPPLAERIDTFQTLSARIGRKKVIWRYDPILFTADFSTTFHSEAFAELAGKLAGSTDRCIVSFLQMYRKCERNMKGLSLTNLPTAEQVALVGTLQNLGAACNISLQTCAQSGELGSELKSAGIPPGKCIDDSLVAFIAGAQIAAGKDKNQRRECGCIESIDIGAYNSCPHHCLYCYANNNQVSVKNNYAAHLPDSPLLYGNIDSEDTIVDRLVKPIRLRQLSLF